MLKIYLSSNCLFLKILKKLYLELIIFSIFFKVYSKGILLFSGVADALKKLRSQFAGSTLNLQGSLKEFSDIEDMLKQESSEFEVSFLLIHVFICLCEILCIYFGKDLKLFFLWVHI